MSDYDCITFHTPACDEHQDRIINMHDPDGLDDVCPICENTKQQDRIAELEAEIERLRAENAEYSNALFVIANDPKCDAPVVADHVLNEAALEGQDDG